ncbi:MAG: hypothetical protein N4A50_03820 [Vallitalea sp.]|jgi:hypothetical protein|nr:hypothetical protein [Vallitalea sp.]
MKKLRYVILPALLIVLSISVYGMTKSYNEEEFVPSWGITDETVKLREDNSGEVMPELVTNPEPYYKANTLNSKTLSISKTPALYDINEKIDISEIEKKGGKVQRTELLSYGEYLQEKNTCNMDTSISKERQIWVVEIYYPNGIKINADMLMPGTKPQNLIIENAIRTTIYDAETGDFISMEEKTLNK